MDVLKFHQAAIKVFVAALILLCTSNGPADEIQLTEPQAKAVYLVNLTKYIDWPSAALPHETSPIIISVIGEPALLDELAKLATAAPSARRPIRVEAFEPDSAKPCHIIFLSGAEKRRTAEVLASLRGQSTVTISEADGFLQAGGTINLARREKKIRLQVNLTAAERARVKISSRLLQVSEVYHEKG